jgi:hypothetical protein
MKYIERIPGEPVLYTYWKNDRRQTYIREKFQNYREFLHPYVRPSPFTKLAELHYLSGPESKFLDYKPQETPAEDSYSSHRRQVKVSAQRKHGQDIDGWERFLFRSSVEYSNDCKEVDKKMDESTKEKVADYLEVFNEIKKKTDDSTVAIALLSEICKDRRMQEIKEQKEANNNESATERQKRFMKNLGIKIPQGVTKKEASMLIDEELGKNNNSE